MRNKSAFFSRIIQAINPPCDNTRLRSILDAGVSDARFNVGVVGRSIEGMSENNKVLLDRMLIDHPQDLTELLHELPWWPGSRALSI